VLLGFFFCLATVCVVKQNLDARRAETEALAGHSRPARRPDDIIGLSPDDGDAVEAVDVAQRTFKELGGPEWKIDLRLVLDVEDDRDARGCHVASPWGRGSCG
jgi:hypothetical protein